jgi:hypothetical protein
MVQRNLAGDFGGHYYDGVDDLGLQVSISQKIKIIKVEEKIK